MLIVLAVDDNACCKLDASECCRRRGVNSYCQRLCEGQLGSHIAFCTADVDNLLQCAAGKLMILLVCRGLISLLHICGHKATVQARRSSRLINVLPHSIAVLQIQDMTSHPVTVYRHRADLSCNPLMWNVTLEYTTTHFNVLGQTRSVNPSPTFHTHQRMLNFVMLLWW